MNSAARLLLFVVVGAVLLAFATVAMAAAAVIGAGSIDVRVHGERGSHVALRVPAGLANVALACVPDSVIEQALREAPPELDGVFPAVRDAWRQLERAPDFVLLEVVDRDLRVRVEKRDGQLQLHVDEDGETVDVALPMKTLRRLVDRLS